MEAGECVESGLSLLAREKAHGEVARELVRMCAPAVPVAEWAEFESLAFEGEYETFSRWMEALLQAEPLPDGTNAFFFGLSRPGMWDYGFAIAVTAGQDYDPADPESGDVEYVPDDPYAPSEILKRAGEIAGLCEKLEAVSTMDDDPATLIELGFATSYGAILVDRWMQEHRSLPALTRLNPLLVLIGETSGEYYLQGALKDGAWIRKDPKTSDKAFARRLV